MIIQFDHMLTFRHYIATEQTLSVRRHVCVLDLVGVVAVGEGGVAADIHGVPLRR